MDTTPLAAVFETPGPFATALVDISHPTDSPTFNQPDNKPDQEASR